MKFSNLLKNSFLIILVSMAFACNNSKSVTVSDYFNEYNPVPENTAIYFRRGACFGTCPEDEIFISLKGGLTYKGKRNARKEGTFKAKNFSVEDYKALEQELISKDIFGFTDDYTGNIADFPPYTIFMQKDGKAIKIEAKSEYPQALSDIINRFAKLIETLELTPAE